MGNWRDCSDFGEAGLLGGVVGEVEVEVVCGVGVAVFGWGVGRGEVMGDVKDRSGSGIRLFMWSFAFWVFVEIEDVGCFGLRWARMW